MALKSKNMIDNSNPNIHTHIWDFLIFGITVFHPAIPGHRIDGSQSSKNINQQMLIFREIFSVNAHNGNHFLAYLEIACQHVSTKINHGVSSEPQFHNCCHSGLVR